MDKGLAEERVYNQAEEEEVLHLLVLAQVKAVVHVFVRIFSDSPIILIYVVLKEGEVDEESEGLKHDRLPYLDMVLNRPIISLHFLEVKTEHFKCNFPSIVGLLE